MILRIFYLLFSLSILFSLLQCKKETPEASILKIQQDKSLNEREAISKILPLVFPYLLKDWKLEEDPSRSKTWNLLVSYGGSTALTFHSQDEYVQNSNRLHAMYNARLVAAIATLPIKTVRLSLTKPLYVKGENHPDVGIQEFEIFRTSIDVETVKSILESAKDISPYADVKKHKTELYELFEKVHKVSSIELNQLRQITVE